MFMVKLTQEKREVFIMKVLEIKNNLVKIEYSSEDNLILSGFVIIEDSQSPYVAQILSLKADNGYNYAIVKLLFTFNEEGIVKNYDGTIPALDAEVSALNAAELLDILPVNTPFIIGNLAHQNVELKVDLSMFEKNLLICSDNFENSNIIINNFISQMSENTCKSVVYDIDGSLEGNKLVFGKDFKLPLNYDTINFIYEHDLNNIDAVSKAIIQDIFLEVQEYSKTVLDKFIPFDTFIDVVDKQHKALGIPELVLLKNKLLKYKEMNVFAQSAKEIQSLRGALRAGLTNIIDISAADDYVQSEIIKYIYDEIDAMDLFVYSFLPLNNYNADKKIIRHILTKNKIYTTFICSHNFKYLYEMKERANNLILFTPQTMQHDFNTYNTFLNKLNPDEYIIYGKATQNIPLIVELASLEEMEEEIQENVEEDDSPEIEPEENQEDQHVEPQKDDFSDESNSYSYETLMEDTAPTAVTLQEKLPEAVILPEKTPVEEQPIEAVIPQNIVVMPDTVLQPAAEPTVLPTPMPVQPVPVIEQTPTAQDIINTSEVDEEINDDNDVESEQEVYEETEEIYEEVEETSEEDQQTSQELSSTEIEEEVDTQAISSFIDKEIEAEAYTRPENEVESEVQEEVDTDINDFLEIPQTEEIENSSEDVFTTDDTDIIDLPSLENIDSELEQAEDFEELPLSVEDKVAQDVDELIFSNEKQEMPSIDELIEQENSEEYLTEDDLNFIQDINAPTEDENTLPIYPAEEETVRVDVPVFSAGDHVSHPKYGEGVVEKMIRYGTKSLCSISFVNVGRRLLDPAISEITKLD